MFKGKINKSATDEVQDSATRTILPFLREGLKVVLADKNKRLQAKSALAKEKNSEGRAPIIQIPIPDREKAVVQSPTKIVKEEEKTVSNEKINDIQIIKEEVKVAVSTEQVASASKVEAAVEVAKEIKREEDIIIHRHPDQESVKTTFVKTTTTHQSISQNYSDELREYFKISQSLQKDMKEELKSIKKLVLILVIVNVILMSVLLNK